MKTLTAGQAVMAFFETHETATVSQISEMYPDVSYSGIAWALKSLTDKGQVEVIKMRTGRTPAIYRAGRELAMEDLPITEQCRRNWHGYHIHKVFGSGGKVRA
ncbi:hypothetical protein [Scandinavium goeteborgense]|uniref:hypothetical protein n=1 Tax=Scandinavium goeteborgense TaxID=1851514 RepID=UPI000F691B41|nr:hypothetical protein [Scandinavium goeteborgense]QKN82213.1 hypothetical protein A8O29_013300 [Scandinavium goeteborgense]